FVELAVFTELGLCPMALRVQHAQLEAGRPSRHRLADATEADDAEGRAGQLLGEEAISPRADPLASAHSPVALDDAAPGCQDQRPRQIRSRGVEHAGRIRDRNSTL